MTCEHRTFDARVDVNRLANVDGGPITAFTASIRIYCIDCAEPFVFIGPPIGDLAGQITRSVDGRELRAPLRPATASPTFGQARPGFVMRVHDA